MRFYSFTVWLNFVLSIIENPAIMEDMLRESPHALVKFQVYTAKVECTYEDRRLNRVKTKNTIPFGPWARMIVGSKRYFLICNQQFHLRTSYCKTCIILLRYLFSGIRYYLDTYLR